MIALTALTLVCLLALPMLGVDATLLAYGTGAVQILLVSLAFDRSMAKVRTAIQVYAFLLCAVSLFSYHQSITLGSVEEPYLAGSDGGGYFVQAVLLAEYGIWQKIGDIGANYLGYQTILALAFELFGADLLVGQLVNNTALVAAVILLAKTTHHVTCDPCCAFFAVLAFMLTTRFIFYSNVLLKDPLLVLGVAFVAYGFVLLRTTRGTGAVALSSIGAAVLIFGTMRIPLLLLVPAGMVVLGRHMLSRGWPIAVVGAAAAGSLATVFAGFTSHDFTAQFVERVAVDNRVLDSALAAGIDAGGVVGRIMGGYTELPLPMRMVTVPLPAVIQFVLPFDFWSTAFLHDHPIHFFGPNLNIVWYLYIGIFALFTVIYWRQLPGWPLQYMFLLGLAMYLLIAFIFGGAIPRYASPYLLLMYPAIGYWMTVWKFRERGAWVLRRFFTLYYAGFAVAGIVYVVFALSRSG